MYLKIMSGQDLPDHAPHKAYRLIQCANVRFGVSHTSEPIGPGGQMRSRQYGYALIDNGDEVEIVGNAYLLNENGKTIDTFTFWPDDAEVVNVPVGSS